MKAFPSEERKATPFSDDLITVKHTGMNLRDYFAAQILPSILSYYGGGTWTENMFQQYAKMAYLQADAMMKVREQ